MLDRCLFLRHVFCASACLLICANALYVDKGFPFKPGPLTTSQFDVTELNDGSPRASLVIFPTVPDEYGIYFFVPGANGVIFSSDYTQYLTSVASHGFVAIATDLLWEGKLDKSRLGFHFGDLYLEQFSWLRSNLAKLLNNSAPGVRASWDHVGLGSHSAGADSVVYMVVNNHTLFRAVVLMGPYTTNFFEPFEVSLPALMIQTELATHHAPLFPACMSDAFGYKHVWQLWQRPPKVRMEIKGYGHCAICDYSLWELCHNYHICASAPDNSTLPVYHNFTQGVTTAFLTSYLTDYDANLKYVTNKTLLPVETLDFAVDM